MASPRTRETVAATARALAERSGIHVLDLRTDDESIQIVLACGEVEAVGFAAELRRLTNTWHQAKHGTPLWRQPDHP